MEAIARVSSKGQVTIPKSIRDGCGIVEGDRIVFRSTDYGAVMVRVPDLGDLAGIVQVPEERKGTAWEKILRQAREARLARLNQ